MRPVLVVPEDLVSHLGSHVAFGGEPPSYLVASSAQRARLARRKIRATVGDPEHAPSYRRLLAKGRGALVVAAPAARLARVVAAIRAGVPDAAVLVVAEERLRGAGIVTVSPAAFADRVLQPELERACARARAERLRTHFYDAERVLILMQDDPDPDAIASALALRTLLGRNRTGAPICTFGTITRPENVAMCEILDIDVEPITPREMHGFDRVAMVDVQPSFLEERFVEVDLVIDHHPVEEPVRAHIRDIRPSYGATSTILADYLRAADVKITQRLATALLYGIKADTLGLERGGTKADLEAFTHLYLLANHNALRRIERPALGEAALDALATGLAKRRITKGVFFSHLGRVATADLIPQFADFGLQAEGVEWSVVSGVVGNELHISVRNVGYVRGAGDVARAAFGDLGSAGGHRTMAKAVLPADSLVRGGADGDPAGCQDRIVQRFLRAIGANGRNIER